MNQYLGLLQDVLENGRTVGDRTGVGRHRVFGRQLRFDLSDGTLPLITTKKIHFKSIVHELLWFLSGNTDIGYLKDNGVNIWDEWCVPKYEIERKTLEELGLELSRAVEKLDGVPADTENYYTMPFEHNGLLVDTEEELKRVIYHDAKRLKVDVFKYSVDAEGQKVIASGECGPIYGRMWRAWPNKKLLYTECDAAAGIDATNTPMYLDDNGDTWYFVDQPIDQIAELVKNLKEKPFSARHIVSGWNPSLLPEEGVSHQENIENGKQALPPCHTIFQLFVEEMTPVERIKWINHHMPAEEERISDILVGEIEAGMYPNAMSNDESNAALIARNFALYAEVDAPWKRLSCQLFQRSCDLFLGASYNIASYSLLTLMLAQVCGYAAGEFIQSLGDTHIYSNHMDQVKLQLTRKPYPLPKIKLNPAVKDIFDFKFEDFELIDYQAHPHIKGDVAV